jgi:hypothetical protein
MDQTTLVNDQLEDGHRLLERLATDKIPVSAAAWLKESEDGCWHLYLATPLATAESGRRQAYRRILPVVQGMSQPFRIEPLAVKVVEGAGALTAAVRDLQRRFPGKWIIPYDGPSLGGVSIAGAYVYPDTRIARVQEFTGVIRKTIETKHWKEHEQLLPPAEAIEQTMKVFAEIVRRVGGDRKTIDLNDPQDASAVVEVIVGWCAEHLGTHPGGV